MLELSLEEVFANCQDGFKRLSTEYFKADDPVFVQLVADLEANCKQCEILIRRERLFSINDTVNDFPTGAFSLPPLSIPISSVNVPL